MRLNMECKKPFPNCEILVIMMNIGVKNLCDKSDT